VGVDDTSRLRRHFERGLVGAVRLVVRFRLFRRPLQGVAVVGLAFYGTWLIYQPAAYLVAAFLLLLDSAT
jgi:hypothetical protein